MAERDDDLVLQRAVKALRELPPLDADAVARIVTSAARIREIDAEPHADDLLPPARTRVLRWPAVAAIAASAAIAGYLVGGGRGHSIPSEAIGVPPAAVANSPIVSPPSAGVAVRPGAAIPVGQASAPAADALPIPTQFVFEAKNAKRVSLVGNFNGWDEKAAPLQREYGSPLWSVTVPLLPGRHVYAFLVDSVLTTDPRAPVTRDPDFGVTSSVVIVGRP